MAWNQKMLPRLAVLAGVLAVSMLFTLGCNPEVKKANFLESAREYEAEGKLPEAVIQYRNVLRIDPDFTQARVDLAKLLMQQGDIIGSHGELKKAALSDPQNAEASLILGQLYLLAGKIEDSRTQVDAVLAFSPENAEALLLRGQILALTRQCKDAEKDFQDLLGRKEKTVEAWMGIAACRIEEGDLPAAEAALRESVSAGERSSAVLLALARFLEENQRLGEAGKLIEEVEPRENENVGNLMRVAAFFMRQGNAPRTEAVLARIRDLSSPESLRRTLVADYHLGRRNQEKAMEELRFLVQNDGPEGVAGYKLGSLLLDQGETDEVEALVEELLGNNRSSSLARFLRGRIKLTRGDAEGALQDLQEAMRHMPNSVAAYYFQGLAYLAQDKKQLARDSFGQALQRNPRHGPARLQRAKLHLVSRNSKEALEDSLLLVQVWPAAEAWQVLVDSLVQNGEIDRAEKLLRELISRSKKGQVRAFFREQAALVAFSQNDFSQGRSLLRRARTDMPVSSRPDRLLAASYLAQNQVSEAERVLITARSSYPDSRELHLMLGRVYLRQGRLAEAGTAYQEVLREDPNYVPARLGMGEVAGAKKDWVQAAEVFEKVGESASLAQAWVQGGQTREKAGQNELAKRDYQEALRIEPGNAIALNNLSWIHLGDGANIDVALGYAEQAREVAPQSVEISDTLGWIYYHKKRYQFAVELLRKAVEEKPDRGLYHYHLGKCYLAQENLRGAKRAFQQALRSEGDFPRDEVRRELRELEARL